MTAMATQRPGWRTGTASIRPGPLLVRGALGTRSVTGLTAKSVIAPAWTPHLSRTFL